MEDHQEPPFEDKFRQLEEILPTPNTYRNAAGQPGHAYWQQQVDYSIAVSLNEDEQRITAIQTVTYHNNSPDTLSYLWLHLDQNRFRDDSHRRVEPHIRGRRPARGGPGKHGANQPRQSSPLAIHGR